MTVISARKLQKVERITFIHGKCFCDCIAAPAAGVFSSETENTHNLLLREPTGQRIRLRGQVGAVMRRGVDGELLSGFGAALGRVTIGLGNRLRLGAPCGRSYGAADAVEGLRPLFGGGSFIERGGGLLDERWRCG